MNFIFLKKFTVLHLAIISITLCGLTYFITAYLDSRKNEVLSENNVANYSCSVDVKRMDGFNYIQPLLFVDEECESERLVPIKEKINVIVERYKVTAGVTNASVYIKSYDDNGWITINENEKYQPGSLFKVPILIAILKMNELNPGFINKPITYSKPFSINKDLLYNAKSIQLGKTYTVKELLNYMIAYSDNNATALLETYMKPEILQKMFKDMRLEVPNMYAEEYLFTVKDYSLFMRTIYNASYLSIDNSEYAAELLAKCNFTDGIVKGLPKGVRIIHKFGEAGNLTERQLHESAIVFVNDKPYLITVMTKGKDAKKLAELIAEISSTVYNDIELKTS